MNHDFVDTWNHHEHFVTKAVAVYRLSFACGESAAFTQLSFKRRALKCLIVVLCSGTESRALRFTSPRE